MESEEARLITVQAVVNASLEKAWKYWNEPEHITGWAVDSDDWKITHAENDLRVGGMFKIRTQTKDGSESVDFAGTYTNIKEHELIEYDTHDGRHVRVEFEQTPDGVRVTESFEPEAESTEEGQRASWLATLDNFKSYVEK
jgi:uncharacterized protein YndB with AHSA1/START domain